MKCKRCNIFLIRKNKTGLCRHCYNYLKNKKYAMIKKGKKLCVQCAKPINPIIKYPDGLDGEIKEIKFPFRCYECRLQQIKYYHNYYKEKLKNKKLPKDKKHPDNYLKNKKSARSRREKKLCVECAKPVNPIIKYPDGLDGLKEIIYPYRCYECRIKQKKYRKKD